MNTLEKDNLFQMIVSLRNRRITKRINKFFVLVLFINCVFFTSCVTIGKFMVYSNNHTPNAEFSEITFPNGETYHTFVFNDVVKYGCFLYAEFIEDGGKYVKIGKAVKAYVQDTGEQHVPAEPLEFYKTQELGEVGKYFSKDSDLYLGRNTYVVGLYEKKDGWSMIHVSANPKIFVAYKSSDNQKSKECLAVQTTWIPKVDYASVKPFNVPPSRKNIVDPSKLPDSDMNVNPASKVNYDSPYYVDGDLLYSLQWLAVKTACIGKYDLDYAGDFYMPNPEDCYTTSNIKAFLVKQGRATRGIMTFEGICFDYADYTYNELATTTDAYRNKISRFWMVGTFDNPTDIINYKIANSDDIPNSTINETPVVVAGHNRIQAHSNAQCHAWVWVQANDGTLYWIDPTWTDNTGRPVFGVVRGGREVQLTPSSIFCVR